VRDEIEGIVSLGMHFEILRETLERAWSARHTWEAMGYAANERATNFIPAKIGDRLQDVVLEAAGGESHHN
jgi:hypothetical protein